MLPTALQRAVIVAVLVVCSAFDVATGQPWWATYPSMFGAVFAPVRFFGQVNPQ